jgi:hypothetical protein
MKNVSLIIAISEWILIGVMGLCSTLAFSHSNAYTWIQEQISARYPAVIFYLPAILWGLIFVLGICLVILAGSSGKFTWIVVLFTAPSLLSFDSINILKIVGSSLPAATSLTFKQALTACIAILVCYVLLNSLCILKKARQNLRKRGAGEADIAGVSAGNHLWLFILVACAILVVIVIALLAEGFNHLILPHLADMPWNFILVGFFCIILLAAYLYWLGLRRNSS